MENTVQKTEDRTLGILVHILGLFTSWIGPLIVYLVSKDGMTKDNARESLNFQISNAIYTIISGLLIFVLIGFITTPLLFVFWLVFTIIASIRASEGNGYRYPLTIRFFK